MTVLDDEPVLEVPVLGEPPLRISRVLMTPVIPGDVSRLLVSCIAGEPPLKFDLVVVVELELDMPSCGEPLPPLISRVVMVLRGEPLLRIVLVVTVLV